MPVPLSKEEWSAINADLPDVNFVCNRITGGELPDPTLWHFASVSDHDLLMRLWKSNVHFRTAGNFLRNARYALGQAVAVRKHFSDKSKSEGDNNHMLADLRSRFYIDYVPLLLFAIEEHIMDALKELYSIPGHKKSNETKLSWLLSQKTYILSTSLPILLNNFNSSSERERTRKYRNNWVHNDQLSVESIFPNPLSPEKSFTEITLTSHGFISEPFDYRWEDMINDFKVVTLGIATLLDICIDEWMRLYQQLN
jgi:hypothetical protein